MSAILRALGAAGAVALGAVGVGVSAELGARWAMRRWGGYYRYTPHWRERNEIDPETLPGFPAGSLVEINGDGERGDPSPRAGERVYRALVVGGSAAECYFLDQGQSWGAVAQRLLGEPEALAALGVARVHVGNASRAIVPCRQLAFMLGKILPRYQRLDLVLIMVGGADVVSWVERGAMAAVPAGEVNLDKLFEQHPEGPWGWRPKETAVWRALSQLNRRLRRPLVVERDRAGWLRRVRRMRAEARYLDEVPDATPMLARFERNLTALIEAARPWAARVIVIRQPWFGASPTPEEERMFWNFGLGRPYRETVTTYFTPRVVDALMQQMDARAVAVATRLGVEQLDVMTGHEGGPGLIRSARTFYDELHFTPEGAEAVGRTVAAAILAPRP